MELDVIRKTILVPQTLRRILTADPGVILQGWSNTSTNRVIHSAAYDIVNRQIVIPVQELKHMIH